MERGSSTRVDVRAIMHLGGWMKGSGQDVLSRGAPYSSRSSSCCEKAFKLMLGYNPDCRRLVNWVDLLLGIGGGQWNIIAEPQLLLHPAHTTHPVSTIYSADAVLQFPRPPLLTKFSHLSPSTCTTGFIAFPHTAPSSTVDLGPT